MNESNVVRIALIVGSTRPNRFADVPARWIEQGSAERSDMTLETLDLRDWPLPFFDEPVSPVATGGVWANPATESWRRKIGEFDGFIVTAAEYNHGATAVLKNALDSALNEWKDKPISFVGYGGVGGARAPARHRTLRSRGVDRQRRDAVGVPAQRPADAARPQRRRLGPRHARPCHAGVTRPPR